MISDVTQLYRELLLDHGRKPRNHHALEDASHHAEGDNPLCGDHVSVYMVLDGDTIRDLSFEGKGCTISMASASLMTETLRGKTVEQAEELFELFHEMLTGDPLPGGKPARMGKLGAMQGVREFPVRVKCATLAWHALKAAMPRQRHSVQMTSRS